MRSGARAPAFACRVPPPVPTGRARSGSAPGVVIAGAGVLLAIIAARGAESGRLPVPPCTFKSLTGHACPGCGATRSLAALSHLDVLTAWHWNPLVACGALLLAASAVLWCIDHALGQGRLGRWTGQYLRGRRAAWPIALLVVANWIYLLRTLQ